MRVYRSALLEYSAALMYEIVADVERYPEFLNWCDSVEILSQSDAGITATMKIAYAGLNIQFTTKNKNSINESITLDLVDGPFTSLKGQWTFIALTDKACKTSIEMDFDFDRSVARRMMGKVFEKLINKQLEAFQQRARALYAS